jgi:hypothetical protein
MRELDDIALRVQPETDYQAQFQQSMADAHAALENHYRVQIEKSAEELRQQLTQEITDKLRREYEEKLYKRVGHMEEVKIEIARVLGILENSASEIKKMVDDPSVQLSVVIRKKAEQSEMQAYLAGLRYSIGETQK